MLLFGSRLASKANFVVDVGTGIHYGEDEKTGCLNVAVNVDRAIIG